LSTVWSGLVCLSVWVQSGLFWYDCQFGYSLDWFGMPVSLGTVWIGLLCLSVWVQSGLVWYVCQFGYSLN
jgi:hypothetical protein